MSELVKIFEPVVARKPDHYPHALRLSDPILKGIWTHLRFSFKRDANEFKAYLSHLEQSVVIRNLSTIAQIEIAVKTFWPNIGTIFPHPSIIDAGYIFGFNETVHNRSYEALIIALGMEEIFEENLKNPVIKGRVDYLTKHKERIYASDKTRTLKLAEKFPTLEKLIPSHILEKARATYRDDLRKQQLYSLILFTLFIENVSLFSQFYVMRWFNRWHPEHKDKNILSEVAVQIQYTRNEETAHARFGIWLFNTAQEQYPELVDDEFRQRIRNEAVRAYEAESKVIEWILGGYEREKLSTDIVRSFIQKRIDDSMLQIGIDPLFMESELRVHDDQHEWFFEEEVLELDADNFDAHNDAYTKDDRSFDLHEDVI